MNRLFPVVLLLLLLVGEDGLLAQNRSNSRKITKQEFGVECPFTVNNGLLKCTNYGSTTAVSFKTGKKEYGLNGIARSRLNLPEPSPIWRNDPTFPGIKVSIGTVLDKGLKFCGG